MRLRVLYTCEVCHTDYVDGESAIECEKSHAQNLIIADCKFHPVSKCGRFPVSVTIRADDGEQRVYRRCNED